MQIQTELTKLFAIRVPLLLAPMAGVSGGALAAAVSGAGGLGLIGGGYGHRDWLENQITAAGNARIGIGFITWSLAKNPELLDVALARAPEAIFLSFGDATSLADKVAKSTSHLIMQVQTLEQARQALDLGADVIVAQGTEAGGHGAKRATMPLVPAVVDIAGSVPVVAAGGVADGRGLAASLMLGAAGCLCGTAFFASQESLAHPSVKAAAIDGQGDQTVRGSVFDVARNIDWPEAWDIRTLRNPYFEKWKNDLARLKASTETENARYIEAAGAGDTDIAAVIVGEGVDFVRSSQPAGDIVDAIETQAIERLSGAKGYLQT